MYIQGSHKNMRLRGSQVIEAYILFSAKEKWVDVWGFKGKEDKSQEDGKSKRLVNKGLPYHAETMGHREDFDLQAHLSSPTA